MIQRIQEGHPQWNDRQIIIEDFGYVVNLMTGCASACISLNSGSELMVWDAFLLAVNAAKDIDR